ncbi:MAG TPA: hypothetical protein VKA79_03070 [Aestuariivirgaceae bacterium]|nr:hypothetical protein [Aestuariivirgaceae bacterium]
MGTVRCTKAGEISISENVYIEVSSAPIVQLLCRHPSSGNPSRDLFTGLCGMDNDAKANLYQNTMGGFDASSEKSIVSQYH